MAIEGLNSFIAQASDAAANLWTDSKLQSVANLQTASELFGSREVLLRADAHILWARWFLEAVCDPQRFVRDYPGYAFLVAEVLPEIERLFPTSPIDERHAVGVRVARLVDLEVRRRQDKRRMALDRDLRLRLWDEAGPEQRCWICGYRFDAQAADEFLGESEITDRALPLFVDYLRPKGLKVRDFRIEIDHVIPVSAGGLELDNLRLACGWCNGHKSDCTSLYDVSGECRILQHPRTGAFAAARPFWIVRILAIRRRCEWRGGCKATVDVAELTVAPIHRAGALNPVNLQLTCTEHDPIGPDRLMTRAVVERMWAQKQRNG
jgi:5-methylcytosine-specific restriction endonuclease McrA